MITCPYCEATVADASMRFCGQCGAKLDYGAEAALPPPPRTEEDVRREREERDRRTMGCVVAVLWFVLPMTFGFGVAKHGGSFWLGFFIGALANGVFRFLWKPFGLF